MVRIVIAALFLITSISCTSTSNKADSFKVYYTPLRVEFYIPPTSEEIERIGLKVEIVSMALTNLYNDINDNNMVTLEKEDLQVLRIKIIRERDGKEVFITRDKHILSGNKKYNIKERIVDAALSDIVAHIKMKHKSFGGLSLE